MSSSESRSASSSNDDDDESSSALSSSSSSSTQEEQYIEEEEEEEFDPLTAPLDTLIDTVVDYDPPSLGWEHVRTYLRSHSIDETKSAIERKGEFATTALHVACRNNPPPDIVDVMVMAAPDMIYWADSFGWLPLHYACANGADIEVVRMLVDAYEDSRLITDKRGRTPLHFALGNVESPPTPDLVRLLAGKKKESVRWPDENGMLPLHYACAYGAPVEVCSVLIESWEDGMGMKDSKGRNALHFAMGNADRANTPSIIETLLSLDDKSQLDILDSDSCLPLHLLSAKAELVEETNETGRENVLNCVNIYLDSSPKLRSVFLVGIRNLPDWLRDVAVIHPTVQTMLNTKITSRFPTMILMLDFYFLAAIIGAFSVSSLQSIERRNNPNNTEFSDRAVSFALLSPLYIGSFYFLTREITQFISVKEQTSITGYLGDPENFLNLTFVFLISYFSVMMNTGWGNDERFQIGCALTIGISWLQVLAYLKSILIEFAVFVSGVIFVMKRIFAFMVCTLIMVVAWAQMYHTLFKYSDECEAYEEMADVVVNVTSTVANVTSNTSSIDDFLAYYDDDTYLNMLMPAPEVEDCEPQLDYPYCMNMWASLYKTYNIMLGEQDDEKFIWGTDVLLLNILFFVLVVILLLNILIAIICDSYKVIHNELAAIVFWGNRLAFIVDMDMITDGPWKDTVQSFFKLNKDDNNEDKTGTKEEKVDISWERILWKKLVECFDPGKEGNKTKMMFLLPWRVCVSTFLIPFWLLVGVLSAGWLWPPQVREGLFVQPVNMSEDNTTAQDAELRMQEVRDLREKLSQVQTELVEEFIEDRKEMDVLKIKIAKIRKELKNEMKTIKKTMTTLFQVQQETFNM